MLALGLVLVEEVMTAVVAAATVTAAVGVGAAIAVVAVTHPLGVTAV